MNLMQTYLDVLGAVRPGYLWRIGGGKVGDESC